MSGSLSLGLPLYRELLRLTRQLPSEARSYYARHIRQGFKNFTDEADPERLGQLAARAREDARWVVEKYARQQRRA
ncbi:hypothetical protein Rsub_10549 [Raphidocelis subcapitata]|uniref:LYR motif-containing protein 9 n=1 Tax=Raphidocelis subcapitata TaxID=307507 RepID=A0A2V0PLC6_9CHLO|nr:hypothetical protein Rsub_10549 [Raphidocelis subcapitata]|eukprot:GBF98137.1 hypothetical protein Rsub_10549 [Raphidocelis subcapitata]